MELVGRLSAVRVLSAAERPGIVARAAPVGRRGTPGSSRETRKRCRTRPTSEDRCPSTCTTTTAPKPASPSRPRPRCRPPDGRRRLPAGSSSACRAQTPSSIDASPRSPAASCRTSRASTPSSRRPYVEDVRRCGEYDVAVLGAPFDGGTTYRSGTRFGPQGIRKISALYGPYSFELGVDLRETITIADLGDIFTIPGNIEKTFDQITKAVSHVYASGAFPVVLGGDHSIGYPTTRGVAPAPRRRQPRDHPLRPARRHPGDRPRRADAHHPVVPRHGPPQRAREEPRPDRDRRLAGAAAGGEGRPRARDDGHDRHRLRRDGHPRGGRAGAGRRVGRRRRRLAVVRRRLPRRRVRPRHRLARARRVPPARGAQVHPDRRRRPPAGRDRGRRVLTALRQRRDHRADRDPGHLRHSRLPGPLRVTYRRGTSA